MDTSVTVKKPFYKTIWFVIAVCFLLLLSTFWVTLQLLFPTTSPLNVISYVIYNKEHPHITMAKESIAFMPYWRMTDAQYARFDLLSEINYFSLTTDGNGNFIKVVGNQTDPGWLQWNSQKVKDLIAKTQLTGNTFSLTIANQRNKTIEALLSSKKAQENLIGNILGQVDSRHLNGIMVDFEYDGMPDEKYQKAFTQFVSDFSAMLHTHNPRITVSLAILPSAGRHMGLFNLPALVPFVDRFVGMTYDYYSQGSNIAGPVAPLYGFKENKFFYDVSTAYSDYLKYIPKGKIIMGIPYYGYDWAVVDAKKMLSKTLSTDDPNSYAAVMSYARAREDKDLKGDQCEWDEYAQEPWCWYIDSNNISHQVWFENNKSIESKYMFAQKNDFAGIAMWTLGYDKSFPDLWTILKNTFAK